MGLSEWKQMQEHSYECQAAGIWNVSSVQQDVLLQLENGQYPGDQMVFVPGHDLEKIF
jgi:hypothetical protein